MIKKITDLLFLSSVFKRDWKLLYTLLCCFHLSLIGFCYYHNFGSNGYFVCLVIGFGLFCALKSIKSIQALFKRKEKPLDKKTILTYVYSLRFLFVPLAIFYFFDTFLDYCPVELYPLIVYLFFVHCLFLLPTGSRYINSRVQSLFTPKIYKYPYAFRSLIIFFKKYPAGRRNPFVLLLAFLTVLRSQDVVLLIFMGNLLRLDGGLSLNLFFNFCIICTGIVCLPSVQAFFVTIYGPKAQRLLGWNNPFFFCVKCGGGGVALAGCYFAVDRIKHAVDLKQHKTEYLTSVEMTNKHNASLIAQRLNDPLGHHQGKYPDVAVQPIKEFKYTTVAETLRKSLPFSSVKVDINDTTVNVGINHNNPIGGEHGKKN